MAQFIEYVYQNQVGYQVSLVGKFVHDLSIIYTRMER